MRKKNYAPRNGIPDGQTSSVQSPKSTLFVMKKGTQNFKGIFL